MGASALLTFLVTQAPGLVALASRLIDQGRDKATAEELADAGLADDRFIRAYLRLYGAPPKGGPVMPVAPPPVVVTTPPLVPHPVTGWIRPRPR